MQGNTKNIPEREREVRSSCDHLQLTWPLGSPWQEPAQPEDDGPLILLDHLNSVQEGEGERGHDQNEGHDGEQEAAHPGALVAR